MSGTRFHIYLFLHEGYSKSVSYNSSKEEEEENNGMRTPEVESEKFDLGYVMTLSERWLPRI